MAEYKQVKVGKLKLKGSAHLKPKKSKKKKRKQESGTSDDIPDDDDARDHAGWWRIQSFEKLNGGNVALQFYNTSYLFALDNGTLKLGDRHSESDDGPVEEEIFTMIKISETKVAFKSGYGKYISVNARGEVLARSDAVGPQEQIEVVIENKDIALQGHNGYFLTITDDGLLKSLSSTAKEREIIALRTNVSRSKKKKITDEEEVGDVRQFEINYVKQFQSFSDHKLRLHEGPSSSLEKARTSVMTSIDLWSEEQDNVLKLLADIHVCVRCVIRIFKGSFGDYSIDETEDDMPEVHCSICLGILGSRILRTAAKMVIDKLKNYDPPTLVLGISMPKCVILRQLAVIMFLQDNGHVITSDCLEGIKKVAKKFITKQIKSLSENTINSQSDQIVNISFKFPGEAEEISKLLPLFNQQTMNSSCSSKEFLKLVESLSDEVLKKYIDCPPQQTKEPVTFDLHLQNKSGQTKNIIVGGQYKKYTRFQRFQDSKLKGIPFLVGKELRQLLQGSSMECESFGQEDDDIIVSGTGRPFYVKIFFPIVTVTPAHIESVQLTINSLSDMVVIEDLALISEGHLVSMQARRGKKSERYKAKIRCTQPIPDKIVEMVNSMKNIEFKQLTPIQFLHLPSWQDCLVKHVDDINLQKTNTKGIYELIINTKAGRSIKEFIHGDLGRTEPSLRSLLGVPIDILELDFIRAGMTWRRDPKKKTKKRKRKSCESEDEIEVINIE